MCKPLITTPLTAASPVTFTDFALDWGKKSTKMISISKLLNKDENEIFKNFQQNYNFSRNSALSGFALYKPPELWIIVNIQENPR